MEPQLFTWYLSQCHILGMCQSYTLIYLVNDRYILVIIDHIYIYMHIYYEINMPFCFQGFRRAWHQARPDHTTLELPEDYRPDKKYRRPRVFPDFLCMDGDDVSNISGRLSRVVTVWLVTYSFGIIRKSQLFRLHYTLGLYSPLNKHWSLIFHFKH